MAGGGSGGQVHVTMTSDEAEVWSSLQKIAGGFRNVEAAGGRAANKTRKGFKKTSGATNELASRLGISTRAFTSWGAAGVAATGAIGAAVLKLMKRMKEVNDEVDQMSRTAAEQVGGSGTRALADIRGTSQEAALMSTYRSAVKYDVSRETAEQAAFTIESGLKAKDVGGQDNLNRIKGMALKTSSLTGAGGDTTGRLVLTAREALGATDPKEFANFMAKARTYAQQSMVTLEEYGGILNEILPEAIKRGIDVDQAMGQIAAMSFRVKDPRKVKTAYRQMMRGTQKNSTTMRKVAKAAGMDVSSMGSTQLMELQGKMLADAASEGPQALGKLIKQLKLPEEIATTYLATTDPASAARLAELKKAGQAATGGQINLDWIKAGGALRKIRTSKTAKEAAKMKEGIAEAPHVALTDEAEAFVQDAMTSSSEARNARILGLTKGNARSVAMHNARAKLEQIVANKKIDRGLRTRASVALEGLEDGFGVSMYETTGIGRRDEMKEAGLVIQKAGHAVDLMIAEGRLRKEQAAQTNETARNLNSASRNLLKATGGTNPDAHLEGAP